MKKILLIHNNYKHLGGEDTSVQNEINFLQNYYEVESLIFSNKNINIFIDLFTLIFRFNPNSNKKLKKAIKTFNPDILYFHNTWYKASLGCFKIAKKTGLSTYIKLHNFRYLCTRHFSINKHVDNNKFCSACGLTNKSTKLFNKYFKDSILKSIAMINYGKKYFNILKDNHFKLLVLTEFHKNYLIDNGFNKNNVEVFPNYMEIKPLYKKIRTNSEKYIVYAGRLSIEKGLEELIISFLNVANDEIKLKIIGTGPQYDYLYKKYSSRKVIFLGIKTNKEVLRIISESICVVSATKLFEGQPTLLCEASALGITSLFPNTGGIKEFFPPDYQYSFEQFNYKDLESKMLKIINSSNRELIGTKNNKYLGNLLDKDKLKYLFDNL